MLWTLATMGLTYRKCEFIFSVPSGTFVLLWRRGSSVLTAGHLKITRDERFKIVDDYNLQISNVKTQDAGDYICQIGDQETRDQVHTVEILGKSIKIKPLSKNELSVGQNYIPLNT